MVFKKKWINHALSEEAFICSFFLCFCTDEKHSSFQSYTVYDGKISLGENCCSISDAYAHGVF